MSSVLDNYKYLKIIFPPDYLESLSEESYLYRLLVEQRTELDTWRQHINSCLELAYRYDLVDSDLEARLKKGDWEIWEATINELKVAKYLEQLFGTNVLRWRPSARTNRIGEFEINLIEPVFIEVKTIFPRELEAIEQRITEKLKHYAEQVHVPSFLIVHITKSGTSDSFSGIRFKKFLIRELSAINADDLGQRTIKLPDYEDDNTGLSLKIETLQIVPKLDEKTCHIGIIGSEARFVASEEYIKYSLNKAYKQRPAEKQAFLVILCSSTAFGIDEDDMLNALLGSFSIRVYHSINRDVEVPKPESFRKLNGFYHPKRNRHLSAIGLYKEKFFENRIDQKLEIYHNPCTINPIADTHFKCKGVRQLVRKDDQEMKWID